MDKVIDIWKYLKSSYYMEIYYVSLIYLKSSYIWRFIVHL